ncbi:hypothetical protein KAH81_01740 [bacterium]|nr:hypothetical protein [bacterium]
MNGSLNWGGTSTSSVVGTNIVYSITIDGIDSYTAGLYLAFQANVANTHLPQLSINGMTAQNIINADATSISPSDIKANGLVVLIYNGTEFRWISKL